MDEEHFRLNSIFWIKCRKIRSCINIYGSDITYVHCVVHMCNIHNICVYLCDLFEITFRLSLFSSPTRVCLVLLEIPKAVNLHFIGYFVLLLEYISGRTMKAKGWNSLNPSRNYKLSWTQMRRVWRCWDSETRKFLIRKTTDVIHIR